MKVVTTVCVDGSFMVDVTSLVHTFLPSRIHKMMSDLSPVRIKTDTIYNPLACEKVNHYTLKLISYFTVMSHTYIVRLMSGPETVLQKLS